MTFTSSPTPAWISPAAHRPRLPPIKKAISGDTPQSFSFLFILLYLSAAEYTRLSLELFTYGFTIGSMAF